MTEGETDNLIQRLETLIKRYQVQGQFSIPFLLEQIRLVQSNEERLLKMRGTIDSLQEEVYAATRKITFLERKINGK